MEKAFMATRGPFRLIYVQPAYSNYRRLAKRLYKSHPWKFDIDHLLSRRVAEKLGYKYVLLARIDPCINRSHGTYERVRSGTRIALIPICVADEGIFLKVTGRAAPKRQPYRPTGDRKFKLTAEEAGAWAFALGVEVEDLESFSASQELAT